MRIIYFTRDYTTHDRRFLAALANTEHKVYYLRLERRGQQLEDRPLPSQIELLTWAGGGKPAQFSDGPRLYSSLKRVIHSLKPDLIQAGPIQSSALLSALAGFHPLVSTSWGSDLLRDAERSAWYRWATRYTLRHSDALVADCETVRRKAVTFGMPAEKIVTFPWGVDLQHFSPDGASFPGWGAKDPQEQNSQESRAPFVILSTRSWEPVYGVDVLARGFVKAAQQNPDLRLVMLGGGSQAGLLRQIFAQGAVQEQVHFPGQIGQKDLPRYYRSADLYLSASRSDGTSISLLEAIACGTPVLVSDIPGNREWVQPGVQGWWFADGDPNALAAAILNAVQARDKLPEMGRAARQLAEQRANWEMNFQCLLKAYEIAARNKFAKHG
jgi:glycosyltransferase involved in cell wall biosynthesis